MRFDSRSKQILLVESVQEGKQGLLSALVERFRVSISTSSGEAIRLLRSRKTRTDLVLVLMDEDAGMCLEILEVLREGAEPGPPVLAVLSEKIDSPALQEMFEAGLHTAIDPAADVAHVLHEVTRRLFPRERNERRVPRAMTFISVHCIGPGRTLTCRAINVGVGGMYLRTDTPFATGTPIEMRFTLPGAPHPCHVHGEVARAVDARSGEPGQPKPIAGMAVRFVGVSRRDELVIQDYVNLRNAHRRPLRKR